MFYRCTVLVQWVITHTHTHQFNGPLSRTIQVTRYQKGKINVDFTEARDSEWQWHQLGRMQVCTSLQADNHASTPSLSFLQAGCPSCHPTNSVKALKAWWVSMQCECIGSGARSVSLRTDEYQVHDVTNALKRFLRNLDDPLLTQNLSPHWTQAAGLVLFCSLT